MTVQATLMMMRACCQPIEEIHVWMTGLMMAARMEMNAPQKPMTKPLCFTNQRLTMVGTAMYMKNAALMP